MDRQSVKTTEKEGPWLRCGPESVVDTSGLLLAVVVHPADVQDRDGARLALEELGGRFSRLRLIWADGGYRGPSLSGWVRERLGCRLEIVPRQAG